MHPLIWNYPTLGVLFEGDNGTCVPYVKVLSGKPYSGNAIEWTKFINSSRPSLGAVVVFDVGRYGHLAVVVRLYEDYMIVSERNYYGLWIVNERRVEFSDPTILGYID